MMTKALAKPKVKEHVKALGLVRTGAALERCMIRGNNEIGDYVPRSHKGI